MVSYGQRIQIIRLEKEMTQMRLAQESGVPQGALSNIERGKRDFTVSTLVRLCYALGVSPAVIFMNPQKPSNKLKLTNQSMCKIAQAFCGDPIVINKKDKNIVDLLKDVVPFTGKRISQKRIYLSWYLLKQKCSKSEIDYLVKIVRQEMHKRTVDSR